MIEQEVQAFCANNGISVSPPGEPLHVVDPESLPPKVRAFVNDDGSYKGDSSSSGEDADSVDKPAQKGKLPEEFPGHGALEAAGITTYAQLRKAGDVTQVDGIGPATAEKIQAALGEGGE